MAKVKTDGAVRTLGVNAGVAKRLAPSGARKIVRRTKSDGSRRSKAKVQKPSAKARKPSNKEAPPPPKFDVLELDPQRKCGAGTSVQLLFKVREAWANGAVLNHLVFLDRHGWYCEHGRNCPAVPHAKKLGDRESRHGPTHNGRMRA